MPAVDEKREDRETAASLQKLDFVFIPLYTAFSLPAHLRWRHGPSSS